jgi:hypothetical protein
VDFQGRLPKGPNVVIPYPIVKIVRNLDVLAGKGKWERKSTKPVLLCFWDMTKTDSQLRLQELATRAEELLGRGVGVILVEINPANREKAADWVRTNQIPYISGAFPPHDEKNPVSGRLVEWRIDGLPWLVLANAEQIIVGEGFKMSQLSEMLKRLGTP